MPKSGARWLIIGAFVVAAALLFGRKTSSGVRVPQDGAEVLEHVASASASGKELKALEAAARERPGDVPRATIEMVTGHYSAATRACQSLLGVVDPLVSTVCSAQVDSLTGGAAGARRAVEEQLATAGPGPLRAWALSVLGELDERAGDDAA